MIECKEPCFRQLYRAYLRRYFVFRVLKNVILPVAMFFCRVRNNLGLVSSLRETYRKHLKKYYIFRLLKGFLLPVFRWFYTIYGRAVKSIREKKYSLVSMSVSKDEFACYSQIIAPSEMLDISGPKFFGEIPSELCYEYSVQLESPKLELIHICNSTVVGGTNFILSGRYVIHPDLFVPSRDVPPAETFGFAMIDPKKGEISLNLPRVTKSVYGAVSLLGQCAGNYSHFLTETLPKLLIIDECVDYEDLPLLVDGWIHPVFFEIIALLNTNRREIIKVERWEPISLTSVIDISPPAYVPPEYREFVSSGKVHETGYDVFPFSQYALNLLRNKAYSAVQKCGVDKKVFSKRLYLRRSQHSCGNARNIINIDVVEKMIKKYGFETVEPASLSFAEQVLLFHDAELIISPVGAALANTIFTKQGCKVIALSPYYKNANYYYFSNLMGTLGHDLYYVLGPQVEMAGHPFHKNYNINVDDLREALEALCV